MHRRNFLATAIGVPAILKSATGRQGYSWTEIEKFLDKGDVKGRVSREDIPTPALLVDLNAFESNVQKMASHAKQFRKTLRPHGKTHKCPEVAQALIRAGAVGACTAKLSEAEVFAREGVTGLLVTCEVVGKRKIERAVRLAAKHPQTMFCVDNAQNVRDLDEAAAAAKVKLNLAVDLLVSGRTGVPPGEPALALAQLIGTLKNVKLAGIQSYAGGASHVIGFDKRREVSHNWMNQAVETRRMFEKGGLPCPLLTGGSTGTYNIDCEIDGVTELQPGSFVFMDVDYNRIGGKDGAVYQDFQNSLSVLTTIVSTPSKTRAICDGGLKAFSTDRQFPPEARKNPGVEYIWDGDEHGILNIAKATAPVNLGDRMEFVIPHCDPSVNLYDRLYCMRGESLEAVWRISARGMSQ